MDNQDRHFHWVVKQGNVSLFADNDKIQLGISPEDHPSCLLTGRDAEDVIAILTELSGAIWTNPDYVKEPYRGKQYRLDDKGNAYWDINGTRLSVGINDEQDALTLDLQGSSVVKIPVNYSVEIIQVMTHFYDKI
ncbi:MAG: hypothetical protein EOO11_13115 [Chitinophagaceae bacterium]|nr:MAG: hypothetical protein EOO11_13115 [Chitinophagaceae bacterium]